MRGEKLRPFHDIVPLWQNCVFNFGNAQGEALKLQGLTERNNEVLLLLDYHKFFINHSLLSNYHSSFLLGGGMGIIIAPVGIIIAPVGMDIGIVRPGLPVIGLGSMYGMPGRGAGGIIIGAGAAII